MKLLRATGRCYDRIIRLGVAVVALACLAKPVLAITFQYTPLPEGAGYSSGVPREMDAWCVSCTSSGCALDCGLDCLLRCAEDTEGIDDARERCRICFGGCCNCCGGIPDIQFILGGSRSSAVASAASLWQFDSVPDSSIALPGLGSHSAVLGLAGATGPDSTPPQRMIAAGWTTPAGVMEAAMWLVELAPDGAPQASRLMRPSHGLQGSANDVVADSSVTSGQFNVLAVGWMSFSGGGPRKAAQYRCPTHPCDDGMWVVETLPDLCPSCTSEAISVQGRYPWVVGPAGSPMDTTTIVGWARTPAEVMLPAFWRDGVTDTLPGLLPLPESYTSGSAQDVFSSGRIVKACGWVARSGVDTAAVVWESADGARSWGVILLPQIGAGSAANVLALAYDPSTSPTGDLVTFVGGRARDGIGSEIASLWRIAPGDTSGWDVNAQVTNLPSGTRLAEATGLAFSSGGRVSVTGWSSDSNSAPRIGSAGTDARHGFVITGSWTTVVDVSDTPTPGGRLSVQPNPCHTQVSIAYTLPRASWVRLGIYDIGGRRVARLVDSMQEPGAHHYHWTPASGGRESVPAGVYFLRLESDQIQESRRLVLTR